MQRRGEPPADAGPGPRGVAVGLLAMAPLFAAYEVGLACGEPDGPRNVAELALLRVFLFLSGHETAVRLAFLAGALLLAFVQVRLAGLPLARALLRAVLEGIGFALLLGPLLLLALALLGVEAGELGLDPRLPGGDVELARAARALGAGAWEELLFRVAFYSALFVLARGVAGFFGAGERGGRWLAEGIALFGSAALFAAGHLDSATHFFGIEGETFDAGVFLWRAVAGLFLVGAMGFLFAPTLLFVNLLSLDGAPGVVSVLVAPVLLLVLGYGVVLLVLHMLALHSLAQNRRGVGSALTHAWRLIRGEPWGAVRASLVDLSLHGVVLVAGSAVALVFAHSAPGEALAQAFQAVLLGAAGATRAAFWARTYRALGGPLRSDNLPGLAVVPAGSVGGAPRAG